MAIRTDRVILSMTLASAMSACAAIVGIDDFPDGVKDGDVDGSSLLNGCDPRGTGIDAACTMSPTYVHISAGGINPQCCIGKVNVAIHFQQINNPGDCILRGGATDGSDANVDPDSQIEINYGGSMPSAKYEYSIYLSDASVPFFCQDSEARGAIIVP